MGKKIRKIIKNNIFGFILGALMFGTVGVLAATYCASSEVSYDNSSSGMESTDVQSAIDELYQLASSIEIGGIKIPTESENGGVYKDENGDIRYYGSNPNNFVSFNNELWRIMGVIDGKTKIIRNESIGNKDWATSGGNKWDTSDLKSYLNDEYLNNINSPYKDMISPSTFYLGGPKDINYMTLTAKDFYDAERDSSQVYGSRSVTITQSIGLMYPSDYGYAAGKSCLSTALNNYNSSCKNSDYLSGVNEWLQSPSANDNYNAIHLSDDGRIYYILVGYDNFLAVRPVLYLTSQTKITGGEGTTTNPYTLG